MNSKVNHTDDYESRHGHPSPSPGRGPRHINDHDVQDWTKRLNQVLAKSLEHIKSKSPLDAQEFQTSFPACCSPIELYLVTWCIPCIMFGKTQHRLHKNGSLEDFEPVETFCFLFWASSCVALHWIPMSMQGADLRSKHHLNGNCVVDISIACCCAPCDLIKEDKEAAYREGLGASPSGVQVPYQAERSMALPDVGQEKVAPVTGQEKV